MFKLELHQNPREIFLHDELLCFIYPSISFSIFIFFLSGILSFFSLNWQCDCGRVGEFAITLYWQV